ncbi:MAG: ACP S-malonyltransferase [Bacteroidales bacterium]|nr:ACP S-malonyltransferase [Bacteroidales bacterium]
MSDNRYAFIFPAFTSDYTDHPGRDIPGFDVRFNEFLIKAAGYTDPELAAFHFLENSFLDHELRTQYITFSYSCALSLLLRKAQLYPAITAGYSMGIYAALFDAGSVSFETGLELIKLAYQSLHASLNNPFGMGTLIGLNERDIQQIIEQASLRIEITNQNASHSFVVSGYRDDMQRLMELAKEEGALHSRSLSVTIPYHSRYLEEGAMNFAGRISDLEISAPQTHVISLIDQISLTTPEIIRTELVRNLFHPLNWYATMEVMRAQYVTQFIECGPSQALAKNARFVDGIRFFPLSAMLP